MRKGFVFLGLAAAGAAAALMVSPEVRAAKEGKAPKGGAFFSYAVQFQCGDNATSDSPSVLEGGYATAATVHNAAVLPATVQMHVALSWPPGEQTPGSVSDANQLVLPAGAALHITCAEIPDAFSFLVAPTQEDYYEGMLVIDSPTPLDVAAIYTSGKNDDGEPDNARVRTLQVVNVPERLVNRGAQVVLCHVPGDSDQTIAVAEAAVQAHLDHGDTLGPCSAPL